MRDLRYKPLTSIELDQAVKGWDLGGSMGLGLVRAKLKCDYAPLLYTVLTELKRRGLPTGLEEEEVPVSDLNITLPELRPAGLQGKAYYAELRRLLKEIGDELYCEAQALKNAHQLTPKSLARLALTYRLNLKATAEFLEDKHLIPVGSYEKVFKNSANVRPVATLKLVWAEMQAEAPAEPEEQPAIRITRKGEYQVPADAAIDYCHSCDAEIIWTRTKNNKPMPLSVATIERRDGQRYALSHFADCEHSKGWKRSA